MVEIKEGDLVLARNEETGEIAYKPVKRVFVVPNRRIYLLKTIDSTGKENTIEVSDDHPFWVVDKKWVESIDLKVGDQLLDANNQVHKVVSFTETDRVETTYNLEVEGYHTYFAGDANMWVHNCNLKNVYNGIKNAPNYPAGFKAIQDGKTFNTVKNQDVLKGLREHEAGVWKKVYSDGYASNGAKVSIHYFQSQSGKVFDVKVKNGWSNK
ncbi:HINT domain-containing protein [Acinetobacter ursingii]|nr:HINT domain-containing protein [Acinetobacter ursingii]